MLAQNFLTADSLGISEDEQDALVKVLGMLERGELTHTIDAVRPNGFNMRTVRETSDCGTVACIQGWAAMIEPNFKGGPPNNVMLFELFCPMRPLSEITPNQAATALRSYLTRGAPHWDEALA